MPGQPLLYATAVAQNAHQALRDHGAEGGFEQEAVDAECGGQTHARGAAAPLLTEWGKSWTSGDLAKKHPDHVKSKRSADRDEEVFGPTADRLDVGRQPNPHVAFGFGTHFCLGAALARLEGRVVLEELLARFGSVASAGPLERAPSSVIAGVRSAPLVFSA